MSQELATLAGRIAGFIQSVATTPEPDPAPFDALATALFAAQCRHNPAYQGWCRARGFSADDAPHWSAFPAVPTEAFKELAFTSIPASERTAEFRSSGTTAQRPSRHFHHPASLGLYTLAATTWFERHLLADLDDLIEAGGLGPLDKLPFLSLTPAPSDAPHSSLVHMVGAVTGRFGARDSVFTGRAGADGAWELDLDRLLFALRKSMCANRPVLLLGTAFNFVHLLDAFEAGNIRYRLAAGSRIMETGGYKGRSRELPRTDLHAALSRRLGVPLHAIVTEYGMCELSSQAYDRVVLTGNDSPISTAPPLRFPPWTRASVVSPETGREVPDGARGLVRIVDLANVWSVATILTSDEAIRRGDRLELVGRAARSEPRGCSLMTA